MTNLIISYLQYFNAVIFIILSLVIQHGNGQVDSLNQGFLNTLEYEELLTLFNEVERDTIVAERVARTYLDRARLEKDTIKMARGYDRLARIFHPERNIAFADSIIALTDHMEHITYPALGHIIKGYEYSNVGDLINGTKQFLAALEIAEKNKNTSQQTYVLHYLIYFKSIWGNDAEALEMQRRRHKIIINSDYLNELKKTVRDDAKIDIDQIRIQELLVSYRTYTTCFLHMKKSDSIEFYLGLMSDLHRDFKHDMLKSHEIFINEAYLELFVIQEEYDKAYDKAQYMLSKPELVLNHDVRANVYLQKGLSEINLGMLDQGINSLVKADSVLSINNISPYPPNRRLYEELIMYYSDKSKDHKTIEYLNKLLDFDSICAINYKYFDPKLIRSMETPKLLDQKEKLIDRLTVTNQKSKTINIVVLISLLTSLALLIYYISRQQVYKMRFENLLVDVKSGKNKQTKKVQHKNELSAKIVNDILESMTMFERKREYLSNEISLQSLAKKLETNANYLSRVINLKMEKNYSNYINDLRVDYAVKELFTDKKFRKYTIKAIAHECGFNSAESFTRAFYRRFGIYPSYYLKRLEKSQA